MSSSSSSRSMAKAILGKRQRGTRSMSEALIGQLGDPLISILKKACLSLLDSLGLLDLPNTPTFLVRGVDWRASVAPHLHDICVDSRCICLAFAVSFELCVLSSQLKARKLAIVDIPVLSEISKLIAVVRSNCQEVESKHAFYHGSHRNPYGHEGRSEETCRSARWASCNTS